MIQGNPRSWPSFLAEVWFAKGRLSAFKRGRTWAQAARVVLLVTFGGGGIAAAADASARWPASPDAVVVASRPDVVAPESFEPVVSSPLVEPLSSPEPAAPSLVSFEPDELPFAPKLPSVFGDELQP